MGKAFVAKLARKGARDPEALAAWIGRRKLGKRPFQKLARTAREGKAAALRDAADRRRLLDRVRPDGHLTDLTSFSDRDLGRVLPDLTPDEMARVAAEMDRRDIAARLPGARPDLIGLSDEELAQRVGSASSEEIAAIAEEADRRQRLATVFPSGQLADDLSSVDENTLGWAIAYARPDEAEQIAAELDRRFPPPPLPPARGADTLAGQLADRAALDRALGSDPDGWAFLSEDLPDPHAGMSSTERWIAEREAAAESAHGAYTTAQIRDMHREHVYAQLLAAEEATNGYLLSARAKAAGVDPLSLFTGPSHVAYARASEELKRWWQSNPRTTLAEYTEQITGQRTAAASTARKSRSDQQNRL